MRMRFKECKEQLCPVSRRVFKTNHFKSLIIFNFEEALEKRHPPGEAVLKLVMGLKTRGKVCRSAHREFHILNLSNKNNPSIIFNALMKY